MTANDTPVVLCVVIHWGSVDDTLRCVESLLKQSCRSREIVVLDNGTDAEIGLRLEDKEHEVRIIHLPENIGFTGGANKAVELAREGNFKWCWILNNDTVLNQTYSLTNLLSFASNSSSTVISPVIQNIHNAAMKESAWAVFFPSLALTLHETGWFPAFLKKCFNSKRFISGTAWFVNVKKAPQPLLDNAYFAYFEDVDLALRLGEENMSICSDVALVHHVSSSTGGSLRKHFFKTRNIVYLAKKHGLWNWRFRISFRLIFILSESRKYTKQLPAFWKTTRSAYIEGQNIKNQIAE